MTLFSNLYELVLWPGKRDFARTLNEAQLRLNAVVAAGNEVDASIIMPILAARDACKQGNVDPSMESLFYAAYAKLSENAKKVPGLIHAVRVDLQDPFEGAIYDAEELMRFASESGTDVEADIVAPILAARTEFSNDTATDTVRAAFYAAYSRLAHKFGDVTADSIRNCSSPDTRRRLAHHKYWAVFITIIIAVVSVMTFVADSMSKRIVDNITLGNGYAAKLRTGLTDSDGNVSSLNAFAKDDPCKSIYTVPADPGQDKKIKTLADVEGIQMFASTIRDIHGEALKLNNFVFGWECDPFGLCSRKDAKGHNEWVRNNEKYIRSQLQINPTIINYPAEVLCRIQAYQTVRSFASNVTSNYSAIIGAILSFALPIFYALLGAFAYQLRLFGETIRKRTYHPSFADSARMITAVIAGAIVGLFNPAKGLALSPLATAFLVGYGVELFFKFLDTILNSFGSSTTAGSNKPAAPEAPRPAAQKTP